MRITLPILCMAAWLLGGCYDSRFRTEAEHSPTDAATTTIARFNAMHNGETFAVTSDVILTGVVTTSDEENNFYRTFCIEQDGAGLEVMAGIDRIHNDFPIGSHVTLRLSGLAAGRSRGVVQIGRMPEAGSGYATDYIGSRPALDEHVVRHDAPLQTVEPALLTIGQLTPARCGTLVRIERLRHTPEGVTEASWAGEKLFRDETGAEIRTYVRDYARFADKEIPTGIGAITGILQCDDAGHFILKPRNEEDLLH